MEKACIRCSIVQNFNQFKVSHVTKNLGNVCRACINSDARKRHKLNPEKRKANKEKYLSNAKNVIKNKESKLLYSRSDKGKAAKRKWVEDNKDFYLSWSRSYCSAKRAKMVSAIPR